jgi:hypothetical protein
MHWWLVVASSMAAARIYRKDLHRITVSSNSIKHVVASHVMFSPNHSH